MLDHNENEVFTSFLPLKSGLREAKFRAPLLSEKGVDTPTFVNCQTKIRNISENVPAARKPSQESVVGGSEEFCTWPVYNFHHYDSVPVTTLGTFKIL